MSWQNGLEHARGPWHRGYLLRVFGNLLRNAAMHAPGAPIQITLARRGELLGIMLADQGHGLPGRAAEAAGSRFASAPDGAAHGFGLWIVRRAVERLGGSVQIRNRPGRGLAFQVELPHLDI